MFEEINRLSREVLIKTKDIVQNLGYELIYADTDSVFIKNKNSKVSVTTDEYTQVIDILRKVTGLPVSIELVCSVITNQVTNSLNPSVFCYLRTSATI